MAPLTYATVCSGIECMSVACRGLPLKPVFFSEIEPFSCAVLKAHYPDVPNLGDMSKIEIINHGRGSGTPESPSVPTSFKQEITNGTTRLLLDARLDILAGGTPCQDVSVAGKRAGMAEGGGTRSSLAFDFVRLARELRPRFVIWENVAGVIDSKNAPDFLRFLSALGDCGYSLAWRVLDAQYVRVDGMERAVPQRRRRVWVVGCLGADESIPAQILFEPDCIAGHTPPRRRTGQGFAYSLARRDRVDAPMVGEPAGFGGATPVRSDAIALDQGAGKSSVNTTVEYSPTLATTHQGEPAVGINNQGGAAPQFTEETSGTMVAASNSSGNNLHGVAYCADGGEVASTITRQISEQSGQDNRANSVVQCFENHAQDSRVKSIEVSDTRNQKDGTGGNNLPLVVHTQTPFVKTAHAKGKDGDGEKWEQCEVVGARNTFDNGEKRCQECIVSTNSNGEDVAPTISSCEYKMGQKQKDTGGGMS